MRPNGRCPRAPIRCTTSLTCSGSLPAAATYGTIQASSYVSYVGAGDWTACSAAPAFFGYCLMFTISLLSLCC